MGARQTGRVVGPRLKNNPYPVTTPTNVAAMMNYLRSCGYKTVRSVRKHDSGWYQFAVVDAATREDLFFRWIRPKKPRGFDVVKVDPHEKP